MKRLKSGYLTSRKRRGWNEGHRDGDRENCRFAHHFLLADFPIVLVASCVRVLHRLTRKARAKASGTKLGRRRVKPSVEARILELRASGDGILKIGKKLGIGTSVVQRVFRQEPWQS